MRRLLTLVTLGALCVSACGDDDDGDAGGDGVTAQERPYVDAMVASFQTAEAGDLTLDAEQAACVAPRWMDTIGLERLERAGVEPADLAAGSDELSALDLSEDEGGALYDAFGECDVDVQDLFVASMSTAEELDADDRACLSEHFDDDLLRSLMVAGLTRGEDALDDDEELTGRLLSVFAACPGVTS